MSVLVLMLMTASMLVAAPVMLFLSVFPVVIVMLATRRVHLAIPTVRHEVDRSAACVVFVTVLLPMLLVSGRNMKVQRLYGRPGYYDASGDHDRGLR